jgi:DNA-binding protein HU-beta
VKRQGFRKKAAEQAQKAVIEIFSSTLEKGDSISLVGFGSFKVVERAAREGRNPSTGEKIQIPASKTVKFTPSKSFKGESSVSGFTILLNHLHRLWQRCPKSRYRKSPETKEQERYILGWEEPS